MNLTDTVDELFKLGAQKVEFTKATLNPNMPHQPTAQDFLPAIVCVQLVPGVDGRPGTVIEHRVIEPSFGACLTSILRRCDDVAGVLSVKSVNPDLKLVS